MAQALRILKLAHRFNLVDSGDDDDDDAPIPRGSPPDPKIGIKGPRTAPQPRPSKPPGPQPSK